MSLWMDCDVAGVRSAAFLTAWAGRGGVVRAVVWPNPRLAKERRVMMAKRRLDLNFTNYLRGLYVKTRQLGPVF